MSHDMIYEDKFVTIVYIEKSQHMPET